VPPDRPTRVLDVGGTGRDSGTLAAAIGGPPPEAFEALSGDDAVALAAIVERAAADRDALIDRAIEDSLRHLPALLRGPVKRALGV
jgi:hypothetical protein